MRQELNEPSEKKPEEEEDDEEHHHGLSLIAADQSAITGESLAVDKYMGDTAYYTTGCKRGKAYGVVTASARGSFVGRTATLVQGAKDQGHFKAIMNSIGTALLVIVVGWILIAWIGGFFHGLEIATPEWSSRTLLHYVLILLVIGVPVGLPVVTTTTLAVGAAYLAKDKAVSKFRSFFVPCWKHMSQTSLERVMLTPNFRSVSRFPSLSSLFESV